MYTSRSFSSLACPLAFVIATGIFVGCSSSKSLRLYDAQSFDKVNADSLVVDPWSLGPDVFYGSQSRQEVRKAESSNLTMNAEIVEVLGSKENLQEELNRVKLQPSVSESASESGSPAANDLTRISNAADDSTIRDYEVEQSGPSEVPLITYTVQLGTFLDREKAMDFQQRATVVLGLEGMVQSDWPFFRLRYGSFISRESADSLHRAAMSQGFYDARVLRITK